MKKNRPVPRALALACLAAAMLAPSVAIAAPRHPYMLFPAEELAAVRERFSLPRFAPVKERVVADAERYLTYTGEGKFESDPESFASRSYKTWAQQRGPSRPAFLWAFLLTGEERYRDALLHMYRHEWKIRAAVDTNAFRFEFTAKSDGYMGALAYDALWPYLGEEDREAFRTYLAQYLVFKDKPSFGWKNNIGTGYFSAVGLIALALLEEHPQAPAILAECVERLKREPYPASFLPHPDGAYPEGALYLDYAMLFLLPFVDTYERVTGDTKHGLLEAEFFRNLHRFAETCIGGDGAWIPFNDSQPQDYGAAWMAFLGKRNDRPLLRWGGDYFYERIKVDPAPGKEVTRSLAPHVLYQGGGEAVPFPGLPTLSILSSINTGSMRSGPELKPGLMVAVRGFGEREVNMRAQHSDVGSFVLYARGENFLIDPGYYHPEGEAHSVLMIDGVPVQVRAPSPLVGAESGDLRSLSIDPTQAYARPKAIPVPLRRTWAMRGDRIVVLVDDVAAAVPVKTLFQTGRPAVAGPGDGSVLLQGKDSDLWIGAFGPMNTRTLEGPLDFGKSWTYRAQAEAGKLEWHRVEAAYQADPEVPMVWVFLPRAKADAGSQPAVEVSREPGEIGVRLGGKEEIRFLRHGNAWIPAGLNAVPEPGD